jgi:hypothetical protein
MQRPMHAHPPAGLVLRKSEVARWWQPPATKYRRFTRSAAYAQAADQHVWSAASVYARRRETRPYLVVGGSGPSRTFGLHTRRSCWSWRLPYAAA